MSADIRTCCWPVGRAACCNLRISNRFPHSVLVCYASGLKPWCTHGLWCTAHCLQLLLPLQATFSCCWPTFRATRLAAPWILNTAPRRHCALPPRAKRQCLPATTRSMVTRSAQAGPSLAPHLLLLFVVVASIVNHFLPIKIVPFWTPAATILSLRLTETSSGSPLLLSLSLALVNYLNCSCREYAQSFQSSLAMHITPYLVL